MRLVLGLMSLAVALSGAAGIGQGGQAIAKTDPVAQKAGDEAFIQEKKDVRVVDPGLGGGANLRGVTGDAYYTTHEISGDNDSPATAQNIGPIISNGWDFTHYSSSGSPTLKSIEIYGNIAQEKEQDWYKFTIYGKADFDIELTDIPNQCDYDLALYKQSNVRNVYSDYETTFVKSSTYGSNHAELISMRLLPGVYYVKVYGYKGYGSPTYNLSIFGDYVREDVCIEDMMERGANAAIWYSDYDPFGVKPMVADLNSHSVGDIYSRSSIHRDDYNHYHPEFPHVLNQQYKQAEIFVWGRTYRNKLRNIVGNALQQAEANYSSAVDLYAATQKVGNTISIVIGALGAVTSIISLGSSTAATVAGVISLSCSLGGLAYEVVSTLFPVGMNFESYQRFIDYLGDLYAALECDAYTSETEVVRIPIRYTLKEVETDGIIYTSTSPSYIYDLWHRTTYQLSYAPAQRQWSYLYDDGGKQPGERRYIHAIDHDGDTPFVGTVYPIVNNESMNMAWNRESYDMTCEDLAPNSQTSNFSLSAGKYKWFKFTAPSFAYYHFLSQGDAEATIDVFDGMVYGKSEYLMNKRLYQNNGVFSGSIYSRILHEGQTIFLRISGGNGDFTSLSSTKIRTYTGSQDRTMSFVADELNLPLNWNDRLLETSQYLIDKGVWVTAKENARTNPDNFFLELEADCHEDWFRSSVTIRFARPIKRIAFDAAYGTGWRYSRNPLIIKGLNLYGQTLITYYEDTMNTGFLDSSQRYCYLLKDPAQGVTNDVFSVEFMLNPSETQDSYHNHYESVHLDGFTVEYAD